MFCGIFNAPHDGDHAGDGIGDGEEIPARRVGVSGFGQEYQTQTDYRDGHGHVDEEGRVPAEEF